MAVPAYTNDLVAIIENITTTTGWTALGGGASGLGVGADFAMQGDNAVDKQISNAEKGQVYNNGATITNTTGRHFYVWIFLATPGLSNTLANRGLAVIAGTSTSAYTIFAVEGSDTYGAAGRVAKCYAIRYANTAGTNRTLSGSPGANPQFFGSTAFTTGSVKGANLGVSAIRYGTGAFLTAGELISAGDGSNNPCTFTGYQVQNDLLANRWGILSLVAGSFELKGKFAIGQNNVGTATLCRFKDNDKTIIIPDTIHSDTDFSQIIFDHASTRVEWTNINITALGTNNKGLINMINTSTVAIITGGTYQGISTTVLRAGAIFTGVAWRVCGLVTLNGATLTGCILDRITSAQSVQAATLANITDCSFISDGSNHAVQLSSIGGGSMTWNNTLTGYVAGVSASPVTPTSTGNEAIYVNVASGTLTINVAAGATVPSIRSAGATVNVIAGAVTYKITVQNTLGTVIQNARVYMPVAAGGSLPYQASVTITRSGSTATVTHTAHGLSTGNKVVIKGAVQREYWGIFTITVTGTNTYTFTVTGTPITPATGTITSTFVLISALTDVLGVVSGSRTFVTNQPISGNVRKSSASPYYKTGALVGTINKDSGLDLTITLLSDE